MIASELSPQFVAMDAMIFLEVYYKNSFTREFFPNLPILHFSFHSIYTHLALIVFSLELSQAYTFLFMLFFLLYVYKILLFYFLL